MMSKEEMRRHLDALRTELGAASGGDGVARDRLTRLTDEIERLIDDPETNAGHPTLVEALKAHAERLEVEHPTITGVLNQILETLSSMGI